MKIADALISNFDLSNYVRVVPDKPINADWLVVPTPVIRIPFASLPTSPTVNEDHNGR